jgi:2-polyprenyl-3-methyl-5-hydroxy-6-metoxy-1,4-benzoquinol methylase
MLIYCNWVLSSNHNAMIRFNNIFINTSKCFSLKFKNLKYRSLSTSIDSDVTEDDRRIVNMKFPDWDELYTRREMTTMPWYWKELDEDIVETFQERNIKMGTLLDLGCGPGYQAVLLGNLGFTVTASDIARSAIEKAKVLDTKNNVKWVVDDILDTKLSANSFDIIFDRGCFHVFRPQERRLYIQNVKKLLKENGLLFLKTFSTKQGGDTGLYESVKFISTGPYQFNEESIKYFFGNDFIIEKVKETVYKGRFGEPKALYVEMKKK